MGVRQFDADQDGDFDPEDVQVLLRRGWASVRMNFGHVDWDAINDSWKREKPGIMASHGQASSNDQLALPAPSPHSIGSRPVSPQSNNGSSSSALMAPRPVSPQSLMLEPGQPGDQFPTTPLSDEAQWMPQPSSVGAASDGYIPQYSGVALDSNHDGKVDMKDVFESYVAERYRHETSFEVQRVPTFVILQCSTAGLLWLIFAAKQSAEGRGSFWMQIAGLDGFSEGWSVLRLDNECEDLRLEIWRWLTYQFTHRGYWHVLMNIVITLLLGPALEGLHGTLRMAVMFNAGVFGAACAFFVGDAHTATVGMSGGCYALMGMRLADLILNWEQRKFRKPILLMLIALVAVDVMAYVIGDEDDAEASASHSAHVGGAIAGVIVGVALGKNIAFTGIERYAATTALLIGAIASLFCVLWLALHPEPQNLWEADAWCWARQVYNKDKYGPNWVCVACQSQACIDTYLQEKYVQKVAAKVCDDNWYGRPW